MEDGDRHIKKKIQGEISDDSQSALTRYRNIVVGPGGGAFLVRYELSMLFLSGMKGALGLYARQKLFPGLFGNCGRKAVFGADIILRSPRAVSLGDNVVISDGAIIDGRSDSDPGMAIGDRSIIGQRAMLLCKEGSITIGSDVGVGACSGLYAVGTNKLTIGDNCLIGPYCYFGGTMYHFDDIETPMRLQGHDLKGGIKVGNDCWFGAGASVMDGVTIGDGAVVASGAVVTRDVAPLTIVAGVPAKVMRRRDDLDRKK